MLLLPRTPKKSWSKSRISLLSIGFPTVRIGDPGSAVNLYRISYSKNVRLFGQLFFEVQGSPSFVLILLLRLFPSDQKHSTRNCIKFADVIFLVLNVDSRGELLILLFFWHRIKEFYTYQAF